MVQSDIGYYRSLFGNISPSNIESRERNPEQLPFPNGWFAVGFSEELTRCKVLTVSFMDAELVLYRTVSGQVVATDPYCPHLGAHLGHGGKVEGENIVCPFHGFKYDPSGYCASHGPQVGPRRIRLSYREVCEINGILYVWRHSEGRTPDWRIPLLDLSDYSTPRKTVIAVRGHIQDFAENTIDVAHTTCVHGLVNPVLAPPCFERHRMEVQLTARWRTLPFRMRLDFHGLGFTHLISELPSLGVRITTLVTATPISSTEWVIRHVQRVHVPFLARIPSPLRRIFYAPLTWYIDNWLKSQLDRDVRIWSFRRYNHNPRLTPGDGPILRFRRWAAQFYPIADAGLAQKPPDTAATQSRRGREAWASLPPD